MTDTRNKRRRRPANNRRLVEFSVMLHIPKNENVMGLQMHLRGLLEGVGENIQIIRRRPKRRIAAYVE